MKTETITEDLARYDLSGQSIEQMRTAYLRLKLDKEDTPTSAVYVATLDARRNMRSKRLSVEEVRKTIKAPYLQGCKDIDAEAKRLTLMMAPIEEHLVAQLQVVDAERDRLKQEKAMAKVRAEAAAAAAAQAEQTRRHNLLHEVGYHATTFEIEFLELDSFEELLKTATAEHANKEEERKAEDAARKAEAVKLAEERAELDQEKAAVAEAKAAAEAEAQAERDEIEAEKKELAEAKKFAADQERAKLEEEERLKFEAEEKVAEEARAKEEAEQKKLRAPIVDRCNDFASLEVEALVLPKGLPPQLHDDIENMLVEVADDIRRAGRECAL